MAITITDECINCGACEPECPNNAIYEGALEWKLSDGTNLTGSQTTPTGNTYEADAENDNVKDESKISGTYIGTLISCLILTLKGSLMKIFTRATLSFIYCKSLASKSLTLVLFWPRTFVELKMV